jgi:hypothetical protein
MKHLRHESLARWRRLMSRSMVTGLIGLVAACGGGGSGGAPITDTSVGVALPTSGPGDVDNRFPLNVGDRRIYRKSDMGLRSLVREDVTETRTLSGAAAYRLRHTNFASGATDSADQWQARTGNGVFTLAENAQTLVYGQSSIALARFPLEVGAPQTVVAQTGLDYGEDLDGDGRDERYDLTVQTEIAAIETVEVAAGTFANTVRLVTTTTELVTLSSDSGHPRRGTSVLTDWYAPGVGLVRQRLDQQRVFKFRTYQMELAAYDVGGHKGPGDALSVTGDPAANSTQVNESWSFPVTASFSRPLDASTVRANSLVVRDASGAVWPGQAAMTYMMDNQLSFSPAANLPVGSYTVSVDPALRDVLGQAPGTTDWRFTLVAHDHTAPSVVALLPSDVPGGLARDALLTLDFDEPIQDDAQNSWWVSIFRSDRTGPTVAYQARMVSPTRMEVQPLTLLDANVRYTLVVRVMDLSNNFWIGGQELTFHTRW